MLMENGSGSGSIVGSSHNAADSAANCSCETLSRSTSAKELNNDGEDDEEEEDDENSSTVIICYNLIKWTLCYLRDVLHEVFYVCILIGATYICMYVYTSLRDFGDLFAFT